MPIRSKRSASKDAALLRASLTENTGPPATHRHVYGGEIP